MLGSELRFSFCHPKVSSKITKTIGAYRSPIQPPLKPTMCNSFGYATYLKNTNEVP